MDAFAVAVQKEFEKRYGGRYTANVVSFPENNGIQTSAADICDTGRHLPARIQLDAAYRSYICGCMGMQEICRDIAALYEKNRDALHRSEDMLKDYEKVKHNVCCRLVNARMNARMLSGMPHAVLHDLAVVFYVILDELQGQLPVSWETFDGWNTDIPALEARAVSNTMKRFGGVVRPMTGMVMETAQQLCGTEDASWIKNILEDAGGSPQLYSVTNRQLYNGSVSILYPGFLKRFADFAGSSFFILPASVHDVIFVPDEDKGNAGAWKQLVKSVNEAESAKEIILSDNVYYYSRTDGKLLLM